MMISAIRFWLTISEPGYLQSIEKTAGWPGEYRNVFDRGTRGHGVLGLTVVIRDVVARSLYLSYVDVAGNVCSPMWNRPR
jgi:hypothetical protein